LHFTNTSRRHFFNQTLVNEAKSTSYKAELEKLENDYSLHTANTGPMDGCTTAFTKQRFGTGEFSTHAGRNETEYKKLLKEAVPSGEERRCEIIFFLIFVLHIISPKDWWVY
jgi:hypothetical protein